MITAVLVAVAALFAAGFYALSRRGNARLEVYGVSLGASAVIGVIGLFFLILQPDNPSALSLPIGLPGFGAHFRLDALSAYFLFVINLVGAATALYGFGYGRHAAKPRRVLPFFPFYLAGMNLVVIADDAFTFLVAWEFMSLMSWLLVLANHRQPGNDRAGLIYLVMAAFGTFCLLLAFGLMAGFSGDFTFGAIRGWDLGGDYGGIVIALVLLGAGSKAGIVPLHAWLPIAHPAAPSHVSALMSGVMTKVALYGLVRVLFDLLGPVSWEWGALILALGSVSAVLGVLYALMQSDLKIMLAYSTVENVGIIVMGLGLALMFQSAGLATLSALALVAALFHVLNHALFKSLLFLGAGAVAVATGSGDMDKQGGLIHRMPQTALLFLFGSMAISALPPFNGFVSEWLLFQAILNSPILPQWVLKFMVPVAGALLALAAALAAACFVKAFGITFLGRPRSAAARNAIEVDATMRGAMAALGALCLLIGIVPTAIVALLSPVAEALVDAPFPMLEDGLGAIDWLFLAPIESGLSSYSGLIVAIFIAGLAAATAYLVHRFASNRLRRAPAWDGGFPDPNPATQYTASCFSQPIRRVFGTAIFHARETVDMPRPGDSRAARFSLSLRDPVWDWLYQPIIRGIAFVAERFNEMQFLSIRRYLSFIFATLVILLSVVALGR